MQIKQRASDRRSKDLAETMRERAIVNDLSQSSRFFSPNEIRRAHSTNFSLPRRKLVPESNNFFAIEPADDRLDLLAKFLEIGSQDE